MLYSREGVDQGDPTSMDAYAMGNMPMVVAMKREVPEALQPWFADDGATVGRAVNNAKCLAYLRDHGPERGFVLEEDKCTYVCTLEDEPIARAAFIAEGFTQIEFKRGSRYLGGFVGSASKKEAWLEAKVGEWVECMEALARIADLHPQAVYAAFTFCLQGEWQYVQRVVPGTAAHFGPLEEAIRDRLLPALLAIPRDDISAEFRQVLTHSVKTGGLAVRNPVKTGVANYATSQLAAAHLVKSLVDSEVTFSRLEHTLTCVAAGKAARLSRLTDESAFLAGRGQNDPS